VNPQVLVENNDYHGNPTESEIRLRSELEDHVETIDRLKAELILEKEAVQSLACLRKLDKETIDSLQTETNDRIDTIVRLQAERILDQEKIDQLESDLKRETDMKVTLQLGALCDRETIDGLRSKLSCYETTVDVLKKELSESKSSLFDLQLKVDEMKENESEFERFQRLHQDVIQPIERAEPRSPQEHESASGNPCIYIESMSMIY